jgi:apolipoprotein D and lipocalin family protein
MKKPFLTLLLAAFLPLLPASANAAPPVASVAAVDLQRYAGRWFEIASFPMFFQRQCIGDTTAAYALKADGEVTVTNRCRTESGFDQAQGNAWAAEPGNNARLKVSFFWPFRSDYWVIGLDPDYRWAVVGNPDRKYLWILSRTAELPKALLEEALKAAVKQGYDLEQLRYTPHGAGVKGGGGTPTDAT